MFKSGDSNDEIAGNTINKSSSVVSSGSFIENPCEYNQNIDQLRLE